MDFLYEFFVKPIETYSGYNLVNTIVYGLILLALAFFVFYPLLNRKGVKFNLQFALAILPYIFFGIGLRILEDLRFLPRSSNPLSPWYYTVSPGIWIFISLLTVGCLLISIYLGKKKNWPALFIFGFLGIILCLPILIFDLQFFQEWFGFFLVIGLTLIVTLFLIKFFSFKLKLFQDDLNKLTLGAQALDGTATFIATQFFACGEQHFLPRAIIGFSPVFFLLIKLVLVVLILYYVDRQVKDKNLRGYIKLIVLVLGFATGLRDLFTLTAGTCGALNL